MCVLFIVWLLFDSNQCLNPFETKKTTWPYFYYFTSKCDTWKYLSHQIILHFETDNLFDDPDLWQVLPNIQCEQIWRVINIPIIHLHISFGCRVSSHQKLSRMELVFSQLFLLEKKMLTNPHSTACLHFCISGGLFREPEILIPVNNCD